MGTPGLFAVLLLVMLSGYAVTGFHGLEPGLRLSIAYPLGLGFISLQMFFYSILSIPFGLFVISAPWVLIGLILALRGLKKIKARPAAEDHAKVPIRPLEWALVAVIVLQASFALLNSIAMPIEGYDTWVIWFLKGKAFFIDRGVGRSFFLNAVYSNGNPGAYEYPLMVPLAVTLGYLGIGGADDQTVKILFSLYYISLLGFFYLFLRSIAGRESSLVSTAMLSTVPRIMEQAGLTGVGYADLPLSVYFLGGAAFGYRYIAGMDIKDLALSAIFLGIGAWTKNEGLTFACAGMSLLFAAATIFHGAKAFKQIALALFLAALFSLPWQIYKGTLPGLSVTMVSDLSFKTVCANIVRLPFIFKAILPKLFTANKYHLTWALYLTGVFVSWRRLLRHPNFLYLHALILIQFAFYIFVYMITTFELVAHIDTSFDRLTIHLLPVAFLCIGISWSDFFEGALSNGYTAVKP